MARGTGTSTANRGGMIAGSPRAAVESGELGPGEPVVGGAWFLIALWVVSVALTALRGREVAVSIEEGP